MSDSNARIGAIRAALLGAVGAASLIWHPVLAATPPTSTSSVTHVQPMEPEEDNAIMRRDARRNWYGGERSPAYRRFLFAAAQAERV